MQDLAQKFNIRGEVMDILISRGYDTEEKLSRFLDAGAHNFSDPFLLSGMREAVGRIRAAIDGGEQIVIYGDYDADGICSVTILYLALTAEGANVNWYIPEREEGYGINEDAIEFIVNEYFPDLIITCDCGISAHAEVELIKELGVDVIVTDHHELPELLPDCTVVNPKIDGHEDTAGLCGAGVAYKLIHALIGDSRAREYLDIAAIATVADSVELRGENRDIVTEGLLLINKNPRPGIAALISASQQPVTAMTLAFSVVPRINAAGRVGEAKRALSLFFERDTQSIDEVVAELNAANTERQVVCEKMLSELEGSEEFQTQLRSAIMVFADSKWQSGIVGIVASKLSERYKRPVFLLCETDGQYKGSGRSVPDINLFELLSSMQDILVRFGGHSQAAGVTIEKTSLDEFKRRANEYLHGKFSQYTKVSGSYDMELGEDAVDLTLARDLQLLEPCGVGNRRPQFLVTARNIGCQSMKKHAAHLVLRLKGFDVTAFNYAAYRDHFSGDFKKRLILDICLNEYRGGRYLKCILRECEPVYESGGGQDELFAQRYLAQLEVRCKDMPRYSVYSGALPDAVDAADGLGTLAVCNLASTFERYSEGGLSGYNRVLLGTSDGNNLSRIVLSPSDGFDFSKYDNIVFLDRPLSGEYIAHINSRTRANIYIPAAPPPRFWERHSISASREDMGRVYRALQRCAHKITCPQLVYDAYKPVSEYDSGISFLQFYAALSVFTELGLVELPEEGRLTLTQNKSELESSAFYRRLCRLLES